MFYARVSSVRGSRESVDLELRSREKPGEVIGSMTSLTPKNLGPWKIDRGCLSAMTSDHLKSGRNVSIYELEQSPLTVPKWGECVLESWPVMILYEVHRHYLRFYDVGHGKVTPVSVPALEVN